MTELQVGLTLFIILIVVLIIGWIAFKRIMKPFFKEHK